MALRQTIPPRLLRVNQEEFASSYWQYEAGQHVSVFGPTGSGKTTLQFKLLDQSATKELPGVVLVVKPKDDTVDTFNKSLRFVKVESWPPSSIKRYQYKDRRGWLVWPKHDFDPKTDDKKLHDIMRRTILGNYKKGNCIIVADETYGLTNELKLGDELIAVWSKGRSMGAGLWSGTQRPAYVPGWMYNQAQHLFIANDPDKRARQRYGEIGGIDPRIIDMIVNDLDKHEFLYIRRDGPRFCILTP
jgi:hypothetical protein